jgi:hypothetical protein
VTDTAVHPSSTPSSLAAPLSDLDLAGAAFLVRYAGAPASSTRAVRSFLGWCASVDVEPLTARR